jgi:hypothetical protein
MQRHNMFMIILKLGAGWWVVSKRGDAMTTVQAFLLGIVIALAPSVALCALLCMREGVFSSEVDEPEPNSRF